MYKDFELRWSSEWDGGRAEGVEGGGVFVGFEWKQIFGLP